MSEAREPIPFVNYDANGRIDMDLPCLKCGYNLRVLADDGDCPECGTGVYDSARLVRLCGYDPVWLRRMARATIWIGIAMVAFLLSAYPLTIVGGWWREHAEVRNHLRQGHSC